jgi:hypothetical protein
MLTVVSLILLKIQYAPGQKMRSVRSKFKEIVSWQNLIV